MEKELLNRLFHLRTKLEPYAPHSFYETSGCEVGLAVIADEVAEIEQQIKLMLNRREADKRLKYLTWLVQKCDELPEKYRPGKFKQWWKLRKNPLELLRSKGLVDLEEADRLLVIVADMVAVAQRAAGVLCVGDEVDMRLYGIRSMRVKNYRIDLKDYKRPLYEKWCELSLLSELV